MSNKPDIEDFTKVLAVEGYSDRWFYLALLDHLGHPGDVYVQQFSGRSEIETKLDTFVTPQLLADKQVIGVIVDADCDGESTGRSISSLLSRSTGQEVPVGGWSMGVPKIGLFVVPGVNTTGEIETLVWRAWRNDPANAGPLKCIDAYLTCMEGNGLQAHSPDKGRIGALLAVRNDDDPRLGPGARARNIFDFTRPEFAPLLKFLSAF